MNFKQNVLTCCFIAISLISFAQQSTIYTNKLKDFDRAVALYQDHLYLASQKAFRELQSTFDNSTQHKAYCDYYIANAAIRLEQEGADELMQNFIDNYPTNPKKNSAYIETGNYYYQATKYAYALKWYSKVNTQNFSNKEKEDYNFKYGYALFSTGNYDQSKEYFGKLLDSQEYGAQAKYYYGHSAYSQDDYETADDYLGQAAENKKYAKNVSYSLIDINFKLGKFEKAIELGEPFLKTSKDKEAHSQVSKIVGESYFNLKKYNEAIPHLKNYKGTKGKWNNTDYYILGYTYYMQKDYENATATFNKIIDGDNAVAQNAYYHLADSYLKLNKKSEALNAFKNTTQMTYDLKLQEEAYLNYAKLSYNIGNPYKSVPEVLQDYLNKYPSSSHKEEINNLLVNAYIHAQDYQGAIDYLEKKSNSNRNNELYQKAAFYRGIQVFNEEKYTDAILNFEKSAQLNEDPTIKTRSNYWIAESQFRLNFFDKALTNYKLFTNNNVSKNTPEYQNIYYNLGYCYFKLKQYNDASSSFKKYIKSNPENKTTLNDSKLRLADTYFVSSRYQDAINTYGEIVTANVPESDYALFQKAISYGFIRKDDQKIHYLNTFIKKYPDSRYRNEAYYVLANEYVDQYEYTDAIKNYDYLIENYKHSTLVSKAMLKKGVIYYNTDQNEKALNTYKSLVAEFPNTPESLQAATSAKQIYIDLGRVDEYGDWIKTVDFIDVSDLELENYTYESAEKQYLESNHKKAIVGFKKYIEQFPNGLHAVKANYYLGQSLYTENKIQQTIPYFSYIVQQPESEYTEQSLSRLSLAYLENDNWSAAIPVLERLEKESKQTQNTIFAQSNLMKAYYQNKEYTDAVSYAEKVLKHTINDDKVISDAEIIIARSAFKTGDKAKAKKAYQKVEKIATGELMAEALYYAALFEFEDQQYEASNTTVQKIAANYSSYKYWGGKSLVVMAKNNYALNDAFQATYILENVIQNFSQFETITNEAQKELDTIKAEEAKTNDSIIPEN